MAKTRKNPYYKFTNSLAPAWKFLKSHPRQHTKGVDGVSINSFKQNEGRDLKAIRHELKNGTFKFQNLRAVPIENREILVCTVKDRIVCKAILTTILPLFKEMNSNRDFSREVSLEGSQLAGVPLATKVIQDNIREGYSWIFETDIIKFFDNIPKDKLLALIKSKVANDPLMKLIQEAVEFHVQKEQRDIDVEEKEYSEVNGVAQGSALSPLFASLYLYEFDVFTDGLGDVRLVRYVDDFVVQCKSAEDAKMVYEKIQEKLKAMGLSIHPLDTKDAKGRIKTRIVNSLQEPFNFLGLTFNGATIDISANKKHQILDDIKAVLKDRRGGFGDKMKIIERKLEGCIKQYKQPHYRTKVSLLALIKSSGDELSDYFGKQTRSLFGKNLIEGLSGTRRKAVMRFFGLDFDRLTRMVK